jgi:hypothetical protein
MAIYTFKRSELKFLLSKQQYENILPVINEHMQRDIYGKDESYQICNIYFDTADQSIIRHSVSKPYFKEKLRLRTYGIPDGPSYPCFIELKRKTGSTVTKRRAKLTLSQAQQFLEDGTFPDNCEYLTKQVLTEIEYFIESNPGIRENVFISYLRDAYFDREDPAFRLTFDRCITTRRSDLVLEDGIYGEQLIPDDSYLMEVKVGGSVPLWLSDVLSENGIRRTSFSKAGKEFTKRNGELKCS